MIIKCNINFYGFITTHQNFAFIFTSNCLWEGNIKYVWTCQWIYNLANNQWFCGGLVAQTVKNLPAMQETWIWSLGQEDTLRREWLPTPVFWPGEFHGQRSLEGLQSMELQRAGHHWMTNTFTYLNKNNKKKNDVFSINVSKHQNWSAFHFYQFP